MLGSAIRENECDTPWMPFKHSPNLFYYLLIGVDYCKYIVHNFYELWNYPYQIEILKLHVSMKEGQPNKFLIKFSLPFSLHAKNKCYYLHQGGLGIISSVF
jgi:hypothetical protein